jgi:phage I-like protein
MSRTPARFTQADVARALRAAQSAGPAGRVEILPDGTIRLIQGAPEAALQSTDRSPAVPVVEEEIIIL